MFDRFLSPISLTKDNISREKKTNALLKHNAFNTPFAKISRCNPSTCPYKGNCVDKSTIEEIHQMKIDFWGEPDDTDAPSRDTRRKLILKILTSSFRSYNKTFEFIIGSKEKNNRLVCESGFLIALGLSNNPNASQAPSQWRNSKKYVLEGYNLDSDKKYSYSELTNSGKMIKEKSQTKFNNCSTYIHNYAITFGDTVPDENGKNLVIFIISNHYYRWARDKNCAFLSLEIIL